MGYKSSDNTKINFENSAAFEGTLSESLYEVTILHTLNKFLYLR